MRVRILAFAHVADVLGFKERFVDCEPADSPRVIFARVAGDLSTVNLRVAVDEEYADWDRAIGDAREIALIPPVSGG